MPIKKKTAKNTKVKTKSVKRGAPLTKRAPKKTARAKKSAK